VRRQLDDIARHHDAAMALQGRALTRMVESGELEAAGADELVTGGLGRRRFLTFGGLAVATSAVVAACASSGPASTSTTSTSAGTTTTTTTSAASSTGAGSAEGDITILRTASSLEHLAVQTYQAALASGLVTDAAAEAAAQSFEEQHAQHARAFEAATTQAGGTPFTQPNPVVKAQVVAPALATLRTQVDVLALAWQLESAASQTYQASIGTFSKAVYNKATASILGVESRHVALLALLLQGDQQPAATYPAYPQDGFQTGGKAVKPGTGLTS
jgi:hypothetical protein